MNNGQKLADEALQVYRFTGLSPLQLMEQHNTMHAALFRIKPWIPTSTAKDGGAARFSENVLAADQVRAALEFVK